MGHEFEPLSGQVIEAAIAVHRELGPGFLESVYESAMKMALRHRGIVYEAQKEVTVFFEGEEVGIHRLDRSWRDRCRTEGDKGFGRHPFRTGSFVPQGHATARWPLDELLFSHARRQGSRVVDAHLLVRDFVLSRSCDSCLNWITKARKGNGQLGCVVRDLNSPKP